LTQQIESLIQSPFRLDRKASVRPSPWSEPQCRSVPLLQRLRTIVACAKNSGRHRPDISSAPFPRSLSLLRACRVWLRLRHRRRTPHATASPRCWSDSSTPARSRIPSRTSRWLSHVSAFQECESVRHLHPAPAFPTACRLQSSLSPALVHRTQPRSRVAPILC